MGEVTELTELEIAILREQRTDYAHFTGPLAERLETDVEQVRAACRGLRDKGMLQLMPVVNEEDGRPHGSAWFPTSLGLAHLNGHDGDKTPPTLIGRYTGKPPTERMKALGITGLAFTDERCTITTAETNLEAPAMVGFWLSGSGDWVDV